MIRKALIVLTFLGAALALVAGLAYLGNAAPEVPAVSSEDVASGRPWVVKLHAQWCPVCMWTKGVWSEIEDAYRDRVNLVVLDFTNEADSEASREEATRLGLSEFFEDYFGATGTIVVLDGRSKEVTASINGSRDFAEYQAAIDHALTEASPSR